MFEIGKTRALSCAGLCVLAFVLAVLCVLLPASHNRAEAAESSPITNSDELRAAAKTGGSYALANDISYEGYAAYVPSGVDFTLDLNGYNIKSTGSMSFSEEGIAGLKQMSFIDVADGATLTIIASRLEDGNMISGFRTGGAIWSAGALVLEGTEGTFVQISECSYNAASVQGIRCYTEDVGGAITATGTVEISDTLFSKCYSVGGNGGAIHLGDGSLTLGDCSIDSCASSVFTSQFGATQGGNAGAIYAIGDVDMQAGSEVNDCTADVNGGAVFMARGALKFKGTIGGCVAAANGGAIFLTGATTATIAGTIDGCSAQSDVSGAHPSGGAIALLAADANVSATVTKKAKIVNCYAAYGTIAVDGTAAQQGATAQVVLDSATIGSKKEPNKGVMQTGAIYVAGGNSSVTAEDAYIFASTDNAFNGGCFYVEEGGTVELTNTTLEDAGRYNKSNGGIFYNCGSVTLDKCSIVGNAAQYGGTLYQGAGSFVAKSTDFTCSYATGQSQSSYGGGVAYVKGGDVSFDHCTFSDFATSGTGSLVAAVKDAGTISFSNGCTIKGAPSTAQVFAKQGGMIYCTAASAKLMLSDCTIEGFKVNEAGGFLYQEGGLAVVENCTVSDCSSGDCGGAVCHKGGIVELTDVAFQNCVADDAGGAYYFARGDLSASESFVKLAGIVTFEGCLDGETARNGIYVVATKENGCFIDATSLDAASSSGVELTVFLEVVDNVERLTVARAKTQQQLAMELVGSTRTLTASSEYDAAQGCYVDYANISKASKSGTNGTGGKTDGSGSDQANAGSTGTSGGSTAGASSRSAVTSASVKTGDATPLAVVVACLCMAAIAAYVLLFVRRRPSSARRSE